MKYKARVSPKRIGDGYCGELIKGFTIEYQTNGHPTLKQAMKHLNEYIEKYCQQYQLNIPLLTPEVISVEYETDEIISPYQFMQEKQEKMNKTPSLPQPQQSKSQPQAVGKSEIITAKDEIFANPTKPKRKPFTPYGLNGYLVDKQGNVRLMLDRRANAHTIVLEPQMFNALAEMVKKTQEQDNVTKS